MLNELKSRQLIRNGDATRLEEEISGIREELDEHKRAIACLAKFVSSLGTFIVEKKVE